MSFERENRYFVFKRSDHTPEAIATLEYLAKTRDHIRDMMGKQPLECVVVESDWPEYETVWDMIQGRVEGEQAERSLVNADFGKLEERVIAMRPELGMGYGIGAQIRRDMVLENNRIAEQADAAGAFAAGEGYYDAYQMMAFALFRTMEE
ncbi:MAG TPA: hypothetical protein VN679_15285 [Candidatus Acidoferrales bacterium]|nr:hypothetical protein [Candidatus Acidoferrales bacterium]